LLRRTRAKTVFGNYEVSGWRHLAAQHRKWILDWPPLLAEDSFLAVHSAPWWPEGLKNVADFGCWLRKTGQSWRALFPYMSEDEDYLWQALAELEAVGKAILFHGHTHQQAVWQWDQSGRLRRLRASTVSVKADHHYAVGVGSVGLPEDGNWAEYVIYDSAAAQIELVRWARRRS
jgi:hypothetical protein